MERADEPIDSRQLATASLTSGQRPSASTRSGPWPLHPANPSKHKTGKKKDKLVKMRTAGFEGKSLTIIIWVS